MVGATVNNKIIPIDSKLKTGDVVSVRTSKASTGPNDSWLKVVKSSHARNKIRTFLNKKNIDKLIDQGKITLEKELQSSKTEKYPSQEFIKENFAKQGAKNIEDLYLEIGKNNISAKTVVQRLIGKEIDKDEILQKQMERVSKNIKSTSETGIVVEGLTSPKIRIANCCLPVPGDNILGYVSKQGGIIVHADYCQNVESLDQARMLNIYWATEINRKFPTLIKIVGNNTPNFLYEVVKVINASNVQVGEMNTNTTNTLESIVRLKILIENKSALEKLIANIQNIPDVYSIERDLR